MQSFTNRAALAIGECEQALALNRNLPDAHLVMGLSKLFIGRGLETEAHIQEALRLSPRDSKTYRWMFNIGLAKQVLGADDEAIVWLRRCIEANRSFATRHFMLAASLAAIGSLEEAKAATREGLALDPTYTIRRLKSWRITDDPTFLAGPNGFFKPCWRQECRKNSFKPKELFSGQGQSPQRWFSSGGPLDRRVGYIRQTQTTLSAIEAAKLLA